MPSPIKTTKPRSEWKKNFKRCRGRIVEEIKVGVGEDDYKQFVFELRTDGLHVRPKGGRRSKEKLYSLAFLAGGQLKQPELKL